MSSHLLIIRAPAASIESWSGDRVWSQYKPESTEQLSAEVLEIVCDGADRLSSIMSARPAEVDLVYAGDMPPADELAELREQVLDASN